MIGRVCLVALGCALSWQVLAQGADRSTPITLDIDGLYPEIPLLGTRPRAMTWSPDSKRLAFTWNKRGEAGRDVWLWSPGASEPQRLTGPSTGGASDEEAPRDSVSEVAWLDETTVAYVAGADLYLREIDAEDGEVVPGAEGARRLSPSPAGDRIAFLTADGLAVMRPGAAPQLLVPTADAAVRISALEWSGDGRRIAFVESDWRELPERELHYYTRDGHQTLTARRAFPGEPIARYRIGVVDVATGMIRRLDRPETTDYVWNLGISDDGSRVFVNGSDALVKHHRIDLYDVATGAREVFYEERDPKHLRPDWRAAWAPGDAGLVILTDRDGFLHLYHGKAPGEPLRQLTSGAWEIDEFWLGGDEDWLYFLTNRSGIGDRQLYRVPFAGGEVERVTSGHGTHQPALSPDGQHVASLFSDDQTPHDLYYVPAVGGDLERITRSPHPAFDKQPWADVRYIEFPSRTDDVTLVGRLSVPRDFDPMRRYPLIVGSVYSDSVTNQFGGRQAHPTWGLDQALVARGYVLLAVNVRGSWGQGRAHNQGLRHGYGIVDIEDLASGVEHLIAEGFVDPERVGIWGSSYGGLMTMMSLFEKPELYAVGIAGAPATNVAHAFPAQRWVMGKHTGDDQPGRYESQSPLYHSEGLEDPLMIIHGTRDQVVLYSDTIAVVEDLIEREQLFELVTLPGVGHGWDAEAPEVRRFAFKKMIEFFDRYLGD